VLLYAPHTAYGSPDGLKRLIDRAHARGLMVLLDVIYNHFGPDGNYLHLYAPHFFDASRQTPWGAAINFTQPPVRRFMIENALYWLEEYQCDGLRLDAIDHVRDPSTPHILEELATEVRRRLPDRHIHLTTEDNRNITRLHERDAAGKSQLYTAEWNDDAHHVAHVIATGETEGYYADYIDEPLEQLARALAEGYVYQGEPSPFDDGKPRGEPSRHLPPLAFVNFLQNHDQIGNRAFGERLTVLATPAAIDVLTAILLLAPQVPMIYMGEEWGETRPFQFFADFNGELAIAVREGRRSEFRKWRQFSDPDLRATIPDPSAIETFDNSRVDWSAPMRSPHRERLALVRRLIEIRLHVLAPLLSGVGGHAAITSDAADGIIHVAWILGGRRFSVVANLTEQTRPLPAQIARAVHGIRAPIFELPDGAASLLGTGELPAWSCVFDLSATDRQT
jgi:malto-oligosyltrehalose trehalohydrolase